MRDLWYIEGVTKVSVEEYYRREFCFFLFTARAQKQDKVGNTIFKKHTKGKIGELSKEIRRTSRRGIGDSHRLASHLHRPCL